MTFDVHTDSAGDTGTPDDVPAGRDPSGNPLQCGSPPVATAGPPGTTPTEALVAAEPRRDPLGIPYDRSWTGSDGTVYYERDRALGGAQGPASWSSEHDCNPICGCHLASRCRSCNVCTSCDGCYCGEWEW